MPTTLPRYAITETPTIAAMLDDAAAAWPGLSRADLVRKLIEAGHDNLISRRAASRQAELSVVTQVSGSMPGVWPADAIQALKDEWPARS